MQLTVLKPARYIRARALNDALDKLYSGIYYDLQMQVEANIKHKVQVELLVHLWNQIKEIK